MGRVITELVRGREDAVIIAGIDKCPVQCEYPVYTSFELCAPEGDVIIDFSRPDMLPSLLDYALKTKTPAVLCTTGYSPDQLDEIHKASAKVALFMSGNMSLGINLMINVLKTAAKILGDSFDVEIIEKHHNQKVDSPSGTALMLANAVNDAEGGSMSYIYDRHALSQKREKREIGIHSVRGGTIVGEHTVLFAGPDECFEITHKAQSRGIFASGAVSAALYLYKQPAGMYNMDDVIK